MARQRPFSNAFSALAYLVQEEVPFYRIAELVGCHRASISRYANGHTEPTPVIGKKLVEVANDHRRAKRRK